MTAVRLSVTRLDLTAPAEPGELLLDLEGPTTTVADDVDRPGRERTSS